MQVPWSVRPDPGFSPFAGPFRTRNAAGFRHIQAGSCRLIFWKRSPRDGLQRFCEDFFTGLTRVRNVAVDFGLTASGVDWLITSGEFQGFAGIESGPHYAPVSSFDSDFVAYADLSRLLCAKTLFSALTEAVADRSLRHLGNRQTPHLVFGLPAGHRVNCSSLIGRAILQQRDSRFAIALRKALRVRFLYGEITPADLARAASFADLFRPPAPSRAPTPRIAESQGGLCS